MYGFTTTLTGLSFDEALSKTTAALKAEGFGVLSEIDIQRAMKEKLGADMPPYRILGACNPPLAHRALQAEPDIGLLLPCNVIVREEVPGRVVVGFLDPQTMVGLVGKPGVKTVADEAMDAAVCIGCGACVAACKNASAALFTSAKITQLALLPQGQAEAPTRVVNMVHAMDTAGFGGCSNEGECEAVCPKGISLKHIATMNREYRKAMFSNR